MLVRAKSVPRACNLESNRMGETPVRKLYVPEENFHQERPRRVPLQVEVSSEALVAVPENHDAGRLRLG